MLSAPTPSLASATPLAVAAIPTAPATGRVRWRREAHVALRVVAACAAALAAGIVVSVGVAVAFLLIAVAAG